MNNGLDSDFVMDVEMYRNLHVTQGGWGNELHVTSEEVSGYFSHYMRHGVGVDVTCYVAKCYRFKIGLLRMVKKVL